MKMDEYKDEMKKKMEKFKELLKGMGMDEYADFDMEKLEGLKDMFPQGGDFDVTPDAFKDMFGDLGKYLDPENMKGLMGGEGFEGVFKDAMDKISEYTGAEGEGITEYFGDLCKKFFGDKKKKKGY